MKNRSKVPILLQYDQTDSGAYLLVCFTIVTRSNYDELCSPNSLQSKPLDEQFKRIIDQLVGSIKRNHISMPIVWMAIVLASIGKDSAIAEGVNTFIERNIYCEHQ